MLDNHLLFTLNLLFAGICTVISFRLGKIVLVGWLSVQGVLANLFVLKQIQLFGLSVTASDVFTVSAMLSMLLLEEFFDKDTVKQSILASCLSLIFFAVISQLHLAYMPSAKDYAQPAYEILFGPNLRIIVASIFAYWLSMQCNLLVYRVVKNRQIPIAVKFVLAMSVAQWVDTICFAYLGLYGIINDLKSIIWFSFIVKMIALSLLSNLSTFLQSKKLVVEKL